MNTSDGAKIDLELTLDDFSRAKDKYIQKSGVIASLTDPPEWRAYMRTNPEKRDLYDCPEQFLKYYGKALSCKQESIANQQAEAYARNIYRTLFEGEPGAVPTTESCKKLPTDLP